MRVLLLDLENSAHLVHTWGLYDQNVSLNQIISTSYMLCFAAQWYGESKMHFNSVHKTTPKKMLEEAHALISEADAIITWNGARHDLPILAKEFILHGMKPRIRCASRSPYCITVPAEVASIEIVTGFHRSFTW